MKYPLAPVHKLIKDMVAGRIYPEMLPNSFDVGAYKYQSVAPLQGEDIVKLTKRVYGEADPWWLLMILNDILSPFEVLSLPVNAPEARGLQAIYTAIIKAVRDV